MYRNMRLPIVSASILTILQSEQVLLPHARGREEHAAWSSPCHRPGPEPLGSLRTEGLPKGGSERKAFGPKDHIM